MDGTGEGRDADSAPELSRTVGLPTSRPLISPPDRVSYSRRPLASTSRSERLSLRIRFASAWPISTSRRISASIFCTVASEICCRGRIAEEYFFLIFGVSNGSKSVGKTPARHHHAGEDSFPAEMLNRYRV